MHELDFLMRYANLHTKNKKNQNHITHSKSDNRLCIHAESQNFPARNGTLPRRFPPTFNRFNPIFFYVIS